MPDWIAVPIIAVVFPLAIIIVVRLVTPYFERKQRERRRQALQDYFEAKECYEKRMRN